MAKYEYKVSAKNGRLPNSAYSIETTSNSKPYRAIRGNIFGGATIGNYSSHEEAYSAIVEDTQKYGATGITIS